MVSGALQSVLSMESGRGDKVTFSELPESFTSTWASVNDIGAMASAYIKPAAMLGGIIGLMLLLATGVMFLAFREMSARLSIEARSLSSTLKDAIETGSVNGAGSGMPAQQNSITPSREPAVHGDPLQNQASTDFWEKADLDVIVAFCFDCLDHPKYSSIPVALINTVLGPARAAELEKRLPPMSMEAFLGASQNLKTSEITAVFQAHQAEYRRATRSPMARQVLSVPVAKLQELSAELQNMEIALLINSLTPLRRTVLLKLLTTAVKIELAATARKSISAVEHKTFETSLTEKLARFAGVETKVEDSHSLDYLTSVILKAENFADDEAMFEQGQSAYTGVLRAFEVFESKDWEELNLQDVAAAFSGYSQKYKDQLLAKYTGKKVEWLKNFISKFESAQVEFNSPNVVSLHESLNTKIEQTLAQKAIPDEATDQNQAA